MFISSISSGKSILLMTSCDENIDSIKDGTIQQDKT
jgi:hypothetical protein